MATRRSTQISLNNPNGGLGKRVLAVGTAVVFVSIIAMATFAGSGEHGRSSAQRARPPLTGADSGMTSVPPKVVPPAYLYLGDEESPSIQKGIPLAWHWLAADGSVVDEIPDGKVVVWPRPLNVSDPSLPVRLRLGTRAPPTRVELRIFDGGIDRFGVPRGTGRLLHCAQGTAPSGGCGWTSSDGGIDVLLSMPEYRQSMPLVLFAEWYVPLAQRPVAARSNPVVSASWGFWLGSNAP